MTNLRAAAEMALEFLEHVDRFDPNGRYGLDEKIDALIQALAQSEQEPVAWDIEGYGDPSCMPDAIHTVPLYTAPPSKPEQEPAVTEKDGSPCPEFWDWLPKAYNFEGLGEFTKYNMEVAFLAGKNTVLAQPEQDDDAYEYAKRLAECIWEKYYKEESPHWRPCHDVLGVLTQIDNMTCGLEKAQPEQESISRCKQCGGALPVTGALDRAGECDCIGQLKVISTIAWFNAPIKTEWGEDMMCASVFIDNNHTLTLYCERSQIHKVPNIIKEQA